MPTTVYRILDEDGDLLYVGIASNVGHRMDQHSEDKPWWHDSAVIILEHFPTRLSALEAERVAVMKEVPVYNVQLRAGQSRHPRGVPRRLIEEIQETFGVKRHIPRVRKKLLSDAPELPPCKLCGRRRFRQWGVRNRAGLCPGCFAETRGQRENA